MTHQASNTFVIQAGTAEWDAVWALLSQAIQAQNLGDGADLAQVSECGEAWQYLGSSREGGRVSHSFRHRAHPSDGLRKNFDLV